MSIERSVEFLAVSLAAGDVGRWDAGMQEVLETVIDLIADGDADGLYAAYEAVEPLHARTEPGGAIKGVDGQLQLLATLLSRAAVRPDRAQVEDLAGREQKILRALEGADGALDKRPAGRGVGACRGGWFRARYASLGNASLVTTHREWRRKLSRITDKGRQLVSEMGRPDMVKEDISVLLAKLLRSDAGPADGMGDRPQGGDRHPVGGLGIARRAGRRGPGRRPGRDDFCHGPDGAAGPLCRWQRVWAASPPSRSFRRRPRNVSKPDSRIRCRPVTATLRGAGSPVSVFENICLSACLMPELPAASLFLKCGNVHEVAETFNVPEELAAVRLEQIGVYRRDGHAVTGFPQSAMGVTAWVERGIRAGSLGPGQVARRPRRMFPLPMLPGGRGTTAGSA